MLDFTRFTTDELQAAQEAIANEITSRDKSKRTAASTKIIDAMVGYEQNFGPIRCQLWADETKDMIEYVDGSTVSDFIDRISIVGTYINRENGALVLQLKIE